MSITMIKKDRTFVLKLSKSALTTHLDTVNYVGRARIPETINFTQKDKVGIRPLLLSAKLIYLYEAQLHNPVMKLDLLQKDLEVQEVFYAN